ncbi:hypothetical protein H4Q26_016395 [Puccinia striiformis f. sp. tritici PST-130]|nr:hypothetical protein H4Q26_016395 [Puccinia striiformis f. sp. tritici PST-130]
MRTTDSDRAAIRYMTDSESSVVVCGGSLSGLRRLQKNNWCGEVSGPTSELARKDAGGCLGNRRSEPRTQSENRYICPARPPLDRYTDPTQVVDRDPDPIEGLSKPWWTQNSMKNSNAGPEELEPRLILECGAVQLALDRGTLEPARVPNSKPRLGGTPREP